MNVKSIKNGFYSILSKHLKLYKVIAAVIAFALIAAVLLFANMLLGNPVSYAIAKNHAEKYVEENYADKGYVLESVNYSFKNGDYLAHVAIPGSEDKRFIIDYFFTGQFAHDTYDSVIKGGNVYRRLDMRYRELADTVLESPSFPYPSDIAFGTLKIDYDKERGYVLPETELVPDKIYDITELGREAGHIVLYANTEQADPEYAAAMALLEIKAVMDQGGVPFYDIDLSINGISLDGFLYSDIYEDGLVERVKLNRQQTINRYTELEAEKAAS